MYEFWYYYIKPKYQKKKKKDKIMLHGYIQLYH